jgi:hypothetical protein
VWALVFANAATEIETEFPELRVVAERPGWMSDAELENVMATHTYDINDQTFGLLAEIIDARRTDG